MANEPKLELIKVTKQGLLTGKANPAKDGYSLTAGEAFNTHDDTIIAVRLAVIGAYKAAGMSEADAVAKFNELNPGF